MKRARSARVPRMRMSSWWIVWLLLLCLGCGSSSTTPGVDAPEPITDPWIVIANRGDGTLSIIDEATQTVIDTVPLPAADSPSTPGYVTWSATRDRIYVGDDANRRIVVLSGQDFSHVADLPAVSDVFHLWHNESQLWAVDRVDKSVAVFDLDANAWITSIPMPADLTTAGGIPHDVVVDADHAFVSLLGIDMAPDAVVRYSTTTLTETGRAPVGEDPHLFLHPTTTNLYVACQDSDAVVVLDRTTMAEVTTVPVDGGHGVWIPPDGSRLYVTNFAGHEVIGPPDPDGAFAVFTIDLDSHAVIDSTHASDSAPHNIASNAAGSRLYVTHSNGGTHVGLYTVRTPSSPPRERRLLTVGTNPFGLCRVR